MAGVPRTPLYLFGVCVLVSVLIPGVSPAKMGESVIDVRGKLLSCGNHTRIVSLAPNITEILFFVGAGRYIKGVTKFCNYPAEAEIIEKIGGIYDPDIEKIIALEPDLVIATKDGNPKKYVEFLQEAEVETFVIDPRNMTEILSSMDKIACLTGASPDVYLKIRSLGDGLERLRGKERTREISVLFLLSSQPLIGAGKGTFIDELIVLAGGVNVLEDMGLPYPRLGIENVLAMSPHVIFWVTSMGEPAQAGPLKKIREIAGDDRVEIVPVDPDVYTRPGPRLFEGLQELSGVIGRVKR